MRRSAMGYAAAAVVAAVAVGTSLGWAAIETRATSSPDLTPGTDGSPAHETDLVRAVSAAADIAIAGAAGEIIARSGFPQAGATGSDPPRVCRESLGGWYGIESARGVDDRRSLNVSVSSWRAGAAAEAFSRAVEAVGECAQPVSEEGQHRLVADARTDPGAGRRSLAALRMGDVLIVVDAATVSGDSRGIAESAMESARAVMKPRLAGRCAAPDSTGAGSDKERDPYGGHYVGRLTPVSLAVPTGSIRLAPELASVTDDSGEADWKPTPAREFPDLAPLDLESVAALGDLADPRNSVGLVDTLGRPLPRERSPRLVDPDALVPPVGGRPARDPGSAPEPPRSPGDLARTRVPEPDPVGPGCGWAFALTQPAVTDPLRLAVGGRQAEIDAISSRAKKQADWLVASIAWPSEYGKWLDLRRAENNWLAFERAKTQATEALERARDRLSDSVERWRSGRIPRVPGPAPSHSGSAAPSPSSSAGTPTPGSP